MAIADPSSSPVNATVTKFYEAVTVWDFDAYLRENFNAESVSIRLLERNYASEVVTAVAARGRG